MTVASPARVSSHTLMINHLLWWMICVYLLVDSVTGFIGKELGLDIKLSLLFKAPLIVFLMVAIYLFEPRKVPWLVAIVAIFMIGPLYQLYQYQQASDFFLDFSFSIKLVMPLIVFMYLVSVSRTLPFFGEKYAEKALWCAAAIVLFNLLIGLAGMGYHTYGEGQSGLGTTGYFYAGNELGGILIVCFCFVLQKVWQSKRVLYVPACLVCIYLSIAVATKSAVMAAVASSVLLPFVNERHLLFALTKRKMVVFVLFIAVLPVTAFYLVDFFQQTDLFARMNWAYDKFGLTGLLLSGRQVFVVQSMDIFAQQNSAFSQLFGIGTSGMLRETHKYSAEVDPIDTLVWYGFVGLFVIVAMALYFFYFGYKQLGDTSVKMAPAIFVANLLLLASACLSGHIWTSGMLGISWAVLNGLALFSKLNNIRDV